MNRLSKLSLAAFGGVTLLMLAVPADAAIGRSTFRASVDEIRRHCERLDESFWKQRRWYGCGDKISCKNGTCVKVVRRPPPEELPTPGIHDGGGKGNGGERGAKSGGNKNGSGNGSSSSAGGPN